MKGDPTSPASHGGDIDLISTSKGLLKSFSEGVRNLLVLDEKLLAAGKEGDRTRSEIKALQEVVYKLVGKIDELDKRVGERFIELDKRLNEIDKRTALVVELEIRKRYDQDKSISDTNLPTRRRTKTK